MLTVALLAASLVAHGDFDFDGKRDTARMVNTGKGDTVLVERRAGKPEPIYLGAFTYPFLAVNHERGWIRTACGKGYDVTCTRRSPNRVRLSGGELLFGEQESSSFVVLYRQGRFVVVQLSD